MTDPYKGIHFMRQINGKWRTPATIPHRGVEYSSIPEDDQQADEERESESAIFPDWGVKERLRFGGGYGK